MDTFLEQSRTFSRAITESFHLINTTRAGLDLLAGQVKRVVDAGAHDGVIEALYPMPDGATGQNLRAHVLRTQEERDRDLAEMWLMTVFARYESWAESLAVEYNIPDSKRGCQFPFQTNGGPGYVEVFSMLHPSQLMEDIYGDSIRVDRLWIGCNADVQHVLRIYRYYKEIRNSLVHSDGRTNAQLAGASSDAHQSLAILQLNQPLRPGSVSVLAVGDPIEINLRLVRDIIDLLHRLVFTIDARILTSTIGFDEFVRRWHEKYGAAPLHVQSRKVKSAAWFSSRVSENLNMPYPILVGDKQKKWPESSRTAFWSDGTNNGMIRSLP